MTEMCVSDCVSTLLTVESFELSCHHEIFRALPYMVKSLAAD